MVEQPAKRTAGDSELWQPEQIHPGHPEAPGSRNKISLAAKTAQHGRMVRMVLQDQHASCRVNLTFVMAPEASHAIEEAVVDQAVNAATDPAFQAPYEDALRRYFAGIPTPSSGFERASHGLPRP